MTKFTDGRDQSEREREREEGFGGGDICNRWAFFLLLLLLWRGLSGA